MLNLKEFKTMNKQVNDYYYLFNIEAKDKPTVCPMCNAVDVAFKKHSSRERELCVANEYKDLIPNKLYKAMMEYEVEIND